VVARRLYRGATRLKSFSRQNIRSVALRLCGIATPFCLARDIRRCAAGFDSGLEAIRIEGAISNHQGAFGVVAPAGPGRSGCEDGMYELPWGPLAQRAMGLYLVGVGERGGQ